jgi:hypothetical protein
MKQISAFFTACVCIFVMPDLTAQGTGQKIELSSSRNIEDSRFTVTATVMDNDTWCRVTWPDPYTTSWELAYDDGEADDFFVYTNPGSLNANKFIPTFHPFIVTGGKIHVGDGSFPGPFLGTSFRVLVFDDDGEDGLPGTALDSMDVTVNNYEWVEFEGMTAEITEGDFYLAMKQLAPSPDAAPIGVDTDNPTYFRSYVKFNDSTWLLSPLQDFMIRAWITGYNEPSRAIDSFEVARFSGFEYNESPLTGDTTVLDTITLSEYNDYEWNELDPGLYAYGVKTHFTGGEWSDYDVSNLVMHIFYPFPPNCFFQADTGTQPLMICPPTDLNGALPNYFLGFNVYVDGDLDDFLPPSATSYLPSVEQPGIYTCWLTAVYDLSIFGYPNETIESSALTTEYILSYGYPLPFLEQWIYGNFETNNWLPEGENWSLNGWEGNQPPAAQFTWDPIQTDYQVALESHPLLADSLTEGQIYLDFDLKLDNYLPTGTEQMLVQVWNWESQEWSTVQTYSNEEGSFDWVSEHLDITDQAMGMVFRIRFLSIGENSLNIVGWYLDNIHVYRECNPPLELEAIIDYTPFGMHLDWEAPEGTTSDQWIQWDDGVNYQAVGVGIPVPFDIAARWESWQLTEFEGDSITKIAFVPNEESSNYRVRVWSGASGTNLIVDQEVNAPTIGEWNTITLLTPAPIDITQDLWVGYQNDGPNGYQMGVDDGPAIDGFGNMLRYGPGWESLLEINPELDCNWNIAAYVKHDIADDTLVKYAIYRSDNSLPYYLRDYTDQTYYLDDSAICEPLGSTHFYKITALYINESDTCESDFSNEEGDICEGIDNTVESSSLVIYPNPASDMLFIESSEKLERISIFDSRGGTVEQWNGGTLEHWNTGTLNIPLNGLAPGIYMVRVNAGKENVSKKIIIMR